MSKQAIAVGFRCGPLQLLLGNEVGITAAELVANGDQTRLGLEDLPGTRRVIDIIREPPRFEEALLKFDFGTAASADELAWDVEIYGVEGTPVPTGLNGLDIRDRKGILAEAALAAWRQRLSDAADSLDPLTPTDAEIVGRIDIPGGPLISELRADRRRSANRTGESASLTDESRKVIDEVVANLRAAVRYGAAGLTDSADGLVAKSIDLACEHGGWIDRLRLLIAVEEVRAIDSLAACTSELRRPDLTLVRQESFDQLLANYAHERRHIEELSLQLDKVVTRLPSAPRNPATRLLRRKAMDDVQKLRRTIVAYSSVVRTPRSPDSPTTTWAATTQTLIALEPATVGGTDPDSQADDQSARSIDESAVLLGELFAERLPAARSLVDDVTRQHPGADAEGRIQIIKRQAIKKLSAEQDAAPEPIPEIVAELAMAIALLREFDLGTDTELQTLGRRLLIRADRIAKLQAQAVDAIPLAAKGFSFFAGRMQPLIAEYLFDRLGVVKPPRPGAAQDAYKAARSKVWRARRDRDIADAAAGGAADAVQRAIDVGAPRLIVRYVDRSLRKTR